MSIFLFGLFVCVLVGSPSASRVFGRGRFHPRRPVLGRRRHRRRDALPRVSARHAASEDGAARHESGAVQREWVHVVFVFGIYMHVYHLKTGKNYIFLS